MRYWGPVLIAIGVALGGLAAIVLSDVLLWWALGLCAAVVLAGITLTAVRQRS
jgi:hypothetical protein